MMFKSNPIDKKISTSILIWILVFSGFTGFIIFSNNNAIAGAGQNLNISNTYTVVGNEIWNNITVKNTGKLIVPLGTSINALNIFLENGSAIEISGGSVILNSTTPSTDVNFNGSCSYFNMTNGAILNIKASDGWADTASSGPYTSYIPISMGGNAELNISASNGITIDNSTINVTGGYGFDLPVSTSSKCNAWMDGVDLDGYTAAGGNTTIRLNLLSPTTPIKIFNSTLNGSGGNGGKAADGGNSTGYDGAKGGGYTNGATVSGYVGSGGSSTFYINSSSSILISKSNIFVHAGKGGDAGNGGSSKGYGGSGGGGYCGGTGVSFSAVAGSGGISQGYVGTGGDSYLQLKSNNTLNLSNNLILISGGEGGRAGDGGGWEFGTSGPGGKGGGGYGGGGGGGYYGGNPHDGYDGYVYGNVGSGGNTSLNLGADNILINNTILFVLAGNGGTAGDPGEDCSNPGGGGYGGGGGGYYNGEGGDGIVIGNIGQGGSIKVTIISQDLDFLTSKMSAEAGKGGDAADGGNVFPGGTPDSSGTTGSGGGGGYGGGGGARSEDAGDVVVAGCIGMGGHSLFDINVQNFSFLNSIIHSKAGNGGNAGDGGNTNDSGPGGGGGFGGGGATDHNGVGGSFSVMGNVGRGGNSTTTLTAVRFIMINSTLNTSGGKGGDGGKGGTKNHTFKQSAGGGGYGGGGGGYSGAYGGGYGNVGGCVGDGGDATTNLIVVKPTISADSEVIAFKGTGGNGSNSSGAGLTGGEGEGRVTSNGNVYLNIPMSISILLSPSNNSDLNGTSKLKWLALHNSTTNGPLSNYIIQIDDDINFNSLELEKTISATEYILGIPLPKGAYYWRVKANYSTPAGCNLGWSEVWKFWSPGIPAVISITKSPSDVYRSLTIWFYVNAEDDLDLESDLFCEMQYRLPFGAWTNFTNIGYIGTAPTGYWAANLSTDTSSSLGIANFRVRFNDTENNLASWSYETFKILNNLPIAEEISFSENYIFRNQSLTIYFNGSDLENSKSNLICIAQYRSPTGIWEDIDNINYISNHWTTTFKRNISVEIGLYDFRVKFIDLDNDQSLWLVKLDILIVKNNIPLAEDIKYSSLSINRTESITIFVNGSDIEDNENSLHCRVQYRSPSGGWIDIPGEKYVYDHWEVDMTPGINAETGNYDFRVRFSDCENNVSSWLEDFDNVTITNIPPEPQDLSYSSSKVFRTNSITIYSNGIDIETSEHLLECIIQYRSPSNDWTDLPGETYNLNRWEVVFTTAKDTELGTYDFRVSYIDEDNNQSSWLEDFDLITVLNNNPKINTENVIIAYEDKFYTVNYKASDIETEILIWTYASNAPWLKWDSENHTIYGTPTNDDVGSYWVTINISDDQEGYDESNFTLTVVNVNDAPSIITQDKKITYEDEEYKVIYTASDIEGDNIKWAVTINGAWLNWGPQNHTLYGVPNNNDNGNYWIRINISDGNGGYDEHVFLLTVVNVNDPPTITGAPTNIELDAFTDKIIDFSPYITDVDNSTSDLKLIINSDYAKTDGLTVTFNYPSSVPSEEVEVTVSDGIDISKPHYIIITVLGDKTNPKIVDWLPIGTKVALNSNISIVFNELMDISNVEKAFSIVPIVNGNFVWYSKTMVFDPTTDLDYNITYKIYIATSATDLAGNNLLKHFTWEFTTVQKPEDDPGPHIKPNESNDNDDDGYLNVWEEVLGTDPDDPNDKPIDTDKDGMPDGDKMNTFSWMDPDDDNDGLVDDAETFEGTDPLNPDTDGDGFNDFIDKYPLDSDKWEKEVIVDDPEEENPWLGILIVAIIIIIIIVILLFIFIIKPKLDSKKSDQSDSEQKPGSFTPPQPPNIGQPPGPQIPPPYQPPQF